jgi:hypothetical protein
MLVLLNLQIHFPHEVQQNSAPHYAYSGFDNTYIKPCKVNVTENFQQ